MEIVEGDGNELSVREKQVFMDKENVGVLPSPGRNTRRQPLRARDLMDSISIPEEEPVFSPERKRPRRSSTKRVSFAVAPDIRVYERDEDEWKSPSPQKRDSLNLSNSSEENESRNSSEVSTPSPSTKTSVSERTVDDYQVEDTGDEMTYHGDDTMEFTTVSAPKGEHTVYFRNGQDDTEGETMEMTTAVGNIVIGWDNEVVNPTTMDKENEVVDETEVEGETMEMTTAVGGIITEEKENIIEGETMEMTTAVGGIITEEKENYTVEDEGVTMEMTTAVGGIITEEKEKSIVEDEGETMEMTTAVGGILAEEKEYSIVEEDTMEMTTAVGNIITEEKENSIVEDEGVTMEMTTAVGGIVTRDDLVEENDEDVIEEKENVVPEGNVETEREEATTDNEGRTIHFGRVLYDATIDEEKIRDTMDFTDVIGGIMSVRESLGLGCLDDARTLHFGENAEMAAGYGDFEEEETEESEDIKEETIEDDTTMQMSEIGDNNSFDLNDTRTHEEITDDVKMRLSALHASMDGNMINASTIHNDAMTHSYSALMSSAKDFFSRSTGIGEPSFTEAKGVPDITFDEFLYLANIRFLDASRIRGCSSFAYSIPTLPPQSLGDKLTHVCMYAPYLELLLGESEEVSGLLQSVQDASAKLEEKMNKNNPLLFISVQVAAAENAADVQENMKILKNHCKVLAKANWYGRRAVLEGCLRRQLESNLRLLQEDVENVEDMMRKASETSFILQEDITRTEGLTEALMLPPDSEVKRMKQEIEEQQQVIDGLDERTKSLQMDIQNHNEEVKELSTTLDSLNKDVEEKELENKKKREMLGYESVLVADDLLTVTCSTLEYHITEKTKERVSITSCNGMCDVVITRGENGIVGGYSFHVNDNDEMFGTLRGMLLAPKVEEVLVASVGNEISDVLEDISVCCGRQRDLEEEIQHLRTHECVSDLRLGDSVPQLDVFFGHHRSINKFKSSFTLSSNYPFSLSYSFSNLLGNICVEDVNRIFESIEPTYMRLTRFTEGLSSLVC